jgi:hypothetical protein
MFRCSAFCCQPYHVIHVHLEEGVRFEIALIILFLSLWLVGLDDPLSTRRAWEEAKAERKRLRNALGLRLVRHHLTTAPFRSSAQLVEREQRAFLKSEASAAAQHAQISRFTDLQNKLVQERVWYAIQCALLFHSPCQRRLRLPA